MWRYRIVAAATFYFICDSEEDVFAEILFVFIAFYGTLYLCRCYFISLYFTRSHTIFHTNVFHHGRNYICYFWPVMVTAGNDA